MLIVALTGGIGSGKSTVAALLAERGAVIVDADRIGRQVVEPGGPAYRAMIDRFGQDIVKADGTLDRPKIAKQVFNDPEALTDLNAITHPAIRETMRAQTLAHAASDQVVVLDVALLQELTSTDWGIAAVIVVDSPTEVAVQRLVRQRGLEEEDARARVKAQISREERRKQADRVIDNSNGEEALADEVEQTWRWIKKLQAAQG